MQQIVNLYQKWCGTAPAKVEPLAKAGSNRRYYRLTGDDGQTVVGVVGTSVPENRCFIYLARHFASKGLPVPAILAVDEGMQAYLQQDLGHMSLYDALSTARKRGYDYQDEDVQLLSRTIRQLPHLQVEGCKGLDFSQCIPPRKFDCRAALFDLNYFKYSFLKTTDLPFDEERLQGDLERLAADLADGDDDHHFLYRDFQARNVMLAPMPEGLMPWFIDFQGGMKGPLHYDVASFLWQASARYPKALRDRLTEDYLDELNTILPQPFPREAFCQRLRLFAFFRMMQVLGAYGLRGYVERKRYFLDSIPLAVSSLGELLDEGCCNSYPYLQQVLQRLCTLPQFAANPEKLERAPKAATNGGPLVVRVFSFSYKKGIPADDSGNGGGYVFDCRSTHNPGRYEPYKQLTGLDRPVIQFLEDDGEILIFLESVYRLADAHVARYIERGFTHLMFSFGCTGGQHRSVYSAQHLAEHLHSKFGIEVRIQHREQGISSVLPAIR